MSGKHGTKTEILKWLIDEPETTPDGKSRQFEVKPWHPKRSLTANSYFHVLCQEIANVLGVSLIEVKNQMIRDYGQINFLSDGRMDYAIRPDDFDYLNYELEHYAPTTKTDVLNGILCRIYIVKRGSHTYDSKEMGILIDGTISEAKELGIDTMTPNELEHLKGYMPCTREQEPA